jgi:nucleoside phosphorylase
MTNILIVDDEYTKPRMIFDIAQSFSRDLNVIHVTTANEARVHIQKNKFDLVLIDVNLPPSLGAKPDILGGVELFDIISLDSLSNLPLDIVFITEKEDSISSYSAEADKRGLSLCLFSVKNNDWKIVLEGKLNLAFNRSKRFVSTNPIVDIAIITALGEPELQAVLNLPYEWKSKRFRDDPTGYHFGIKNVDNKKLSVVAASAWRKGMPSSAALAMKMVERFRPKYIVMLGICAGVKGKVNLGDVIVANPSWDWGSGKLSQETDGSQIFQSAPHQKGLEHHISQLAMELASDTKVISSIMSSWDQDLPQGKLSIHVGPLASGASVLAANDVLKSIEVQNRDLMGVDMEAYAVMAAADYARQPAPISLVIKSVCDFADSEKSNIWQKYSSYTSASFFDRLIANEFFPI